MLEVAEEAHHPAMLGTPGQDGQRGRIGEEEQVGLLGVRKACNRRSIKRDAPLKGPGEFPRHDGDVLLPPVEIAKGKADELDVVLLHEFNHFTDRVIHCAPHFPCISGFPRAWRQGAPENASCDIYFGIAS